MGLTVSSVGSRRWTSSGSFGPRPGGHQTRRGCPLGNSGYLALVAANVGAVIMPWMVFYQQAAILDKGLTRKDLRGARIDTALGAVLTQVVMIAVLVPTGATLFRHHPGSLDTVPQISAALVPYLGATGGRVAFALGVTGAALVAGIVVSLAAAWAFAELVGVPRSLNRRVRQAPPCSTGRTSPRSRLRLPWCSPAPPWSA